MEQTPKADGGKARKTLRAVRRFLASMPLAITLLVLLAAACAVCSAIPQGRDMAWYTEQYGEQGAAWIIALHADDAYHSGWFIALSGFLCVSLIMCNLTRVRSAVRRTRENPRNWAGIWGAWVCHLGILLLIVGFALGQMTQEEYTAYAAPGRTVPIEGTDMSLTVDRFEIEWREDGSANQYTADITVTDGSGRSESGTASVNHPAELFGYEFLQNTAGWTAEVTVVREGTLLQRQTLCEGEFVPLADDPDIVVLFYRFYPNYDGTTGRASPMASVRPDRPGYVYMVYCLGELRGMNVLEPGDEITIDEKYTVTFDHPGNYPLLLIKRDRFAWIALIGAAVTMAGLIMALYLRKGRKTE